MNCTQLAGKFSRNGRLSSTWQAAKDDEHSELPLYSWAGGQLLQWLGATSATNC